MNPNNSNSSQTWGETNFEDVSVEALDQAFSSYVEARNDYDEKNKTAKEAHAIMADLEWKFLDLLKSAGKTNWNVDGLGKCSEYERTTYQTPKSAEDKKALAKYIQDKYGKESFWNLFSVNSQTLNSWVKEELQDTEQMIPGLSEPSTIKKLRLTRSKK